MCIRDRGNINRFDWGIAVQGSIYWKRLFLNVAYQKGLKSANITDEDVYKRQVEGRAE